VKHPLSGQIESLSITREMVLGLIQGPLYSPPLASALPFAIDQAALGHWDALLGLGFSAQPPRAADLAMGMHFSVVCAEDFPRIKMSVDQPGRDFGDGLGRSYERICTDWPRADLPAEFYTIPTASSAVLLLSGGLDPVTPPRHAQRVAKALGAKAKHVVVAHAGHGVMTLQCMRDALPRFIDAEDDAQAAAVDFGCAGRIPRPPVFVPTLQGTAP
jgi:pimeloyl-ACP methyl ester carboxylesterase